MATKAWVAKQQRREELVKRFAEIRRQLKPLGQQAEIAKEAATIAAVVRDARARLLADEVVELRAAITDFSRSESERKTERIVLQEQLDQNKLREGRLEQAQVGDAVPQHVGERAVEQRVLARHVVHHVTSVM